MHPHAFTRGHACQQMPPRCTQARIITELKKVLTSKDAPLALRLVFADAASYDAVTGTGGLNGSIVLP